MSGQAISPEEKKADEILQKFHNLNISTSETSKMLMGMEDCQQCALVYVQDQIDYLSRLMAEVWKDGHERSRTFGYEQQRKLASERDFWLRVTHELAKK